MPGLFVTATGTDIGKTYVTCGLLRAGRRAGLAMDALKPVLTGYADAEAATSDAGRLAEALGLAADAATIARLAPFRFAAPLSPNMAAAMEGATLDLDAVAAACRAVVRPDRLSLIEGIGGVMVPLDRRHTVLDLIVALGLPVMLVGGTGLGALSHMLTAVAALRARGVQLAIIVLNETQGSSVPLAATRATIVDFCAKTPVALLPREAGDAAFDALLGALRASFATLMGGC